jgi:hypothetical protein
MRRAMDATLPASEAAPANRLRRVHFPHCR